MSYHRTIALVRCALLRVARRLRFIVIVLFILYAISTVALILQWRQIPSHGAAFGAIILLVAPMPIFACEFLAVFMRWTPASYYCVALWLIVSAWALLTPVAVASNNPFDSSDVAFTILVFVPAGLIALFLAALHSLWPTLLRDNQIS
jgi:hypothetical protein